MLNSGSVEAARAPQKAKMRTRCPMPVIATRPNSITLRLRQQLRGAISSRSFLSVITGWSRGQRRSNINPDSDRLALPRPPNLDLQYQALRQWCQEKITKSS